MRVLTECNQAAVVADILAGQTIIFPTETSYGLGCDATNQAAVDAIFKIKGRRGDKPLLVVVPDVEMAKKYLVWNETLEKVAKKYWPPYAEASEGKPGPVTVVGQVRSLEFGVSGLASGVVSKDNTVAVRVTANEMLKSITQKMGRPLVATSANLSDTGDIYDSSVILAQFTGREFTPDMVLNFGVLPVNPPTTIVSVVDGAPRVLRQGAVAIEL